MACEEILDSDWSTAQNLEFSMFWFEYFARISMLQFSKDRTNFLLQNCDVADNLEVNFHDFHLIEDRSRKTRDQKTKNYLKVSVYNLYHENIFWFLACHDIPCFESQVLSLGNEYEAIWFQNFLLEMSFQYKVNPESLATILMNRIGQ